MAKRSPAMTKFSPRCTRARKSGIRYRNDPAFHFSSSVSRLSDTQSAAGVIWSVSMASSFLAKRVPGRLIASQKISALPRITAELEPATAGSGSEPEVTPFLQPGGFDRVHHIQF